MSESKSRGITALRYQIAVAEKNPNQKFITLRLADAEEIMEKTKHLPPSGTQYSTRSVSVKGACVLLAMSAEELVERLNGKRPAQYMAELAAARNEIYNLKHGNR